MPLADAHDQRRKGTVLILLQVLVEFGVECLHRCIVQRLAGASKTAVGICTAMTLKDWITIVLAVLAFGLSSITAYYGFIRTTDEISVVMETIPFIDVMREEKKVVVTRSLRLLFINSGSRPAIILGVDVQVDETDLDKGPLTRKACEGDVPRRWLGTTLEPFVIKEKEIIEKRFEVAPSMESKVGEQKINVVLPTPQWFGPQSSYAGRLCLTFRLVTPARSDIVKDAEVQTQVVSQPTGSIVGGYTLQKRPLPLWRERGTVFGD
jgi:hypothetical protein